MWLPDNSDAMIVALTHRLRHMTGLDQSLAEMLQIANYGLGGHYEPHYDMAMDDEVNPLNTQQNGNRIATVLFYVSCPRICIVCRCPTWSWAAPRPSSA